jgi:hypothetical protein
LTTSEGLLSVGMGIVRKIEGKPYLYDKLSSLVHFIHLMLADSYCCIDPLPYHLASSFAF